MTIPANAKKILIFDDDEDILFIVSALLKHRGYVVDTFKDCDDATARVLSVMPDVIIMDNWIPPSGGVAASRDIKAVQTLKNIPVIYFTANNNIQSLAIEAGANACLAKPFEMEDLYQVVERMLSLANT